MPLTLFLVNTDVMPPPLLRRRRFRQQPLGTDRSGRQFFVFPADPLSVYVQPTTPDEAQGLANEGDGSGGGDGDDARAAAAAGGGGGGRVWKVRWCWRRWRGGCRGGAAMKGVGFVAGMEEECGFATAGKAGASTRLP